MKLNKMLFATLFGIQAAVSGNVLANDDMVNGYVVSPSENVMTNYGECVRTPFVDSTDKPEICGYEKVVMKAEVVVAPTAATVTTKVMEKITIAAELLFAFDSAELSDDAKAVIDERINRFQGKVKLTSILKVVGHTDSTGPEAYNQGLSERRAQAVADYIMTHAVNVAASDIEVVGKGETDPVASNDTREGRAKNRRVVIWGEGEVKK